MYSNFSLGYQECMSEAMRFLVEVEGHFPREAICVRLLSHLQKHCETISRPSQSTMKECTVPEVYSETNGHINSSPVVVEKTPSHEYMEVPNNDREPNNNNVYAISEENLCIKNCPDSDLCDKHSDSNGSVSYKYKNDIKLRFSQDLNSAAKRQKLENNNRNNNLRRTSVTSIENHR